ncbi:MAG: AbrB/MazE/SpoVT family DNA-binding domain-containing protein [Clostridia bacterium]|nr:AbrB/MazE/SpoVT family DNA-binding domain-containing protein [Clostridia bacterium]
MKKRETGIYRHVDALGRIVLPMEIRNTLDIQTGDALEISVENEKIVLKKQQQRCVFCLGKSNLVKIEEKFACAECIKKIKGDY